MKKVLIVAGHPNLAGDSVANKTIIDEIRAKRPEYELDILGELYPNHAFDIAAEQEKLRAADVIVFQFPVFWYSMPSLLRKWVEEVVVHGFAYGTDGTALQGKRFIASFTTGAPAEAYTPDGFVGYTIEEVLNTQFKPMAKLCSLDLQPFVYTQGVSYANRTDDAVIAAMQQRSREHAQRLIAAIEG